MILSASYELLYYFAKVIGELKNEQVFLPTIQFSTVTYALAYLVLVAHLGTQTILTPLTSYSNRMNCHKTQN